MSWWYFSKIKKTILIHIYKNVCYIKRIQNIFREYIFTFPYEKKLKSIDRVEKDIKYFIEAIHPYELAVKNIKILN